MAEDEQGRRAGKLNPGDEQPGDTRQTGENLCWRCKGSGRVEGAECPACGGTGRVVTSVGDA